MRSGSQRRWFTGNPKRSGMTPTMVAVAVPIVTNWPMTDGSRANRVAQRRSPMTATSGSASRSSRAVSVRPSSGGVPISVKALAVISTPLTASTRWSAVTRFRLNPTPHPGVRWS